MCAWVGLGFRASSCAPCACLQDSLWPPPPWPPLLTEEEVQRSQAYMGSGSQLRQVAQKLVAGQPIRVVMLGGSITRGVGASKPASNFASSWSMPAFHTGGWGMRCSLGRRGAAVRHASSG